MSNQQKIIDGTTYVYGYMPPEEAISVQVAVAKVIGEPLFKAFMQRGSTEDEQAVAGAAAIGLMMSRMSAGDLIMCMKSVFKYTAVGGKSTTTDMTHFQGKNKQMWQVFLGGLAYNFSDFMPASLLHSVSGLAQKFNQ